MSRHGHYRDSARTRNTEQSTKPRETPGSQPWKAAIIRDLREGYGVEDVALRMECDVEHVRAFVDKLRRLGLLPELYKQARSDWQSVGDLARRLAEKAGGAK